MATYYLAVNGQPTGPFTVEQLAQQGLNAQSLVWNESMPQWTPASQIAELQVLFNPQQQQPYRQHFQQPYQQPYQPQYEQPQYGGVQHQVSFTDAIKRGFSNYCCFTGRASRSEYWWFALFYSIVYFVLYIVAIAITVATYSTSALYLPLAITLACFLPGLGLFWRRMHDIGRSGAWFFLSLIPIIGGIVLLVFLCQESQPHENEYGPVPNVY